MARSQNSFTTKEVLSFLVDNYDIPGGGKCSDISDMKDEVEDIDSVVNNSREMDEENANDGFDFDDIRQIDVVDAERPSQRAEQLPIYDFSNTEWSDDMVEDESVSRGMFTETVGPTNILPSSCTAIDFLKLLLSLNIMGNIVLETNRYACQQFAAANTKTRNKLTVEEFMAFLGILIGMGLKGVSSLCDCWSQDWVLGIPSLACVMPVARFREILKYLHLNDNDKMLPRDNPDFDKLLKVRPLVDSLKANFKL